MVNDPPQPNSKELLLIDISQHVPSAVYTAQRLHAWRKDYDLDDSNTVTAVLINKQAHMVLGIAATVVQIVGMEDIKLRFFNNDREKAIAWLLSHQ